MKIVYRIGQFLICKGQTFFPWHMPQMITGRNSLHKIPLIVQENHLTNIMVITTNGFIKRGTLSELLEMMEKEGLNVTIYDQVQPDPTIACIEAAVSLYHEQKCQGIVAIGGGSVIDCAKIVGARISCPHKTIRQMKGFFKIRKKLPFFLAVPTTAGTGSEVTAAAVVTDEEIHLKYSVNDVYLLPAYAVLDPELTRGLSPQMTAATGMDALTHAVEAYINRFSVRQSDVRAVKAVRLIMNDIEDAYHDGNNMNARAAMLEGASLAGMAFTKSFIGYVHALAHAIGGLYGLQHGYLCAVILPIVLEAYGSAVYKPLSELAKTIGIADGNEMENAKQFIAKIHQMNQEMNLPETIAELQEKDLQQLAERAEKEANPAYPVPVIWGQQQFVDVLKRLMK